MKKKPNLLFIFSDQHSSRVAGCYGDPVAETPNLDRLAKNGVVFENCYAPSPICTPSRMSLLTARYPSQQGVWTNDDMLGSNIPTFPHSLGAAGYRPSLAGRLHALGPDQYHGYVERRVGDHSPNWPGVPRHNMGVLKGTNEPSAPSVVQSGIGSSSYELLDADTTESALAMLTEIAQKKEEGDDEAFALSVGFMLPHAPYVASEEDYQRFAGKVPQPEIPASTVEDDDHPFLKHWRKSRGTYDFTNEECMRARIAYYALTYRLDVQIGKVLDLLQELGLAEDTIVVYSSDHGDQIGERGLWWKHTFYDQSVKVPLIISWPGVLPRSERREQLVDLLDVTATMLEACGAPKLPNSNGRSFLDVAKDNSAPWVNRVFSEYCMDGVYAQTEGGSTIEQRMVREGPWKFIYYHGYPCQLFNLDDDPLELNDRSRDPQCAAVVQSLQELVLADWDPEMIAVEMKARLAEKKILSQWAMKTKPSSVMSWPLRAEQNTLNNP